jgi:membrane protein DedA with SNARE-associated domain
MSFLKQPIPLNFRTIVFCFFESSILSIPIGAATTSFRHYTLPEWVAGAYWFTAVASIFLLPAWTLIFLPDIRILRYLAAFTFLSACGIGILFPAL